MPQYVAVTGATGFIGSALCRRLIEADVRVRALVRNPEAAGHLADLGVELCRGDLGSPAQLSAFVTGVDAVVHCAGNVRGSRQQDFDRVNVDGLRHLLDALKVLSQPPRLLVLSSLAAREPQLSFYARSKHRSEQLLQREAQGLRWTALRPPAVYGPGDKEVLPLFQMMSRGLAVIPGKVDARFSMIYVDDLVAAIAAWLQGGRDEGEIFTLDDGREGGYSWVEAAAIMEGLSGRRVRLFAVPAWLLDSIAVSNRWLSRLLDYAPMLTPEKLRELRHPDWISTSREMQNTLDWHPRIQLSQGLQLTLGLRDADKGR